MHMTQKHPKGGLPHLNHVDYKWPEYTIPQLVTAYLRGIQWQTNSNVWPKTPAPRAIAKYTQITAT